MKKLAVLFLAVLLVCSSVACGNGNETPDTQVQNSEVSEETTQETEPVCEHDYVVDTTVDPTCDKEGYTVYICSICGDKQEKDQTEKLNHVFISQVTQPTETEKGYTTYTCEMCGYSYQDSFTDVLPEGTAPIEHIHEFVKTVKAPTCTSEGYTINKCECGEAYNDNKTPATGHKYEDKVVAPTCTAGGYTIHKCKTCGSSYTDSFTKAISHTYTSKVIAPTREEQGYTLHTCEVCGSSYKDNYTDKLCFFEKPAEHTHSYTSVVTKPTCTSMGYTTYTCSCGDSYIDNKTSALSHSYVNTVTKPTCTSEGYTTHKCKNCGSAYTDNKVPATGHKYTDKVVSPTCENDGYTLHTCSCSASYKDNITKATGHKYSVTSDTATCTADGTKTETCANCGNKKTSTSKAKGHGETKTEAVSKATCYSEGKERTYCAVCNATLSEKTSPKVDCHYVTMMADDAANGVLESSGDYATAGILRGEYNLYVDVCEYCYNTKNVRLINSGTSAATEMLGYVNALREAVYGTSDYNLVLDPACVAHAQLRAKEIYSNYGHYNETPYPCSGWAENILVGSSVVYSQYMQWYNSAGHYRNMIDEDMTNFGYGAYIHPDAIEHWKGVTGVQTFTRIIDF